MITYKRIAENEREKDTVPDFLTLHSGFSDSELDYIIDYYTKNGLRKATVEGKKDDYFRIAQFNLIDYDENSIWIYEKIYKIVEEANKHFKFNITHIVEEPQFIEYKQGCHIDWHIDKNPISATRKLNLSIQLTEYDQYTGGDLLVYRGGGEPIPMSRDRGTVSIFPSYVVHRVSPVTSGVRNSIICWITGPNLR